MAKHMEDSYRTQVVQRETAMFCCVCVFCVITIGCLHMGSCRGVALMYESIVQLHLVLSASYLVATKHEDVKSNFGTNKKEWSC